VPAIDGGEELAGESGDGPRDDNSPRKIHGEKEEGMGVSPQTKTRAETGRGRVASQYGNDSVPARSGDN
jgi:hypothetical protein